MSLVSFPKNAERGACPAALRGHTALLARPLNRWVPAMLVASIGALVILYARYYLADDDPAARFYAFFMLFMGAMLGVVLAAELARTMGVEPSKVLVCEDGDRVTLTDRGIERSGTVPAKYLYVDGIVGDALDREIGSLLARCWKIALAMPRLPSEFSKSIGLTLCGMVEEPISPATVFCLK